MFFTKHKTVTAQEHPTWLHHQHYGPQILQTELLESPISYCGAKTANSLQGVLKSNSNGK
jgi:hypothetical protein